MLKILKKLRTASLNSEFTGFYKKSVMNKTATSAAQLAKCILLQAYSRTTAVSSYHLTSWHNRIFG